MASRSQGTPGSPPGGRPERLGAEDRFSTSAGAAAREKCRDVILIPLQFFLGIRHSRAQHSLWKRIPVETEAREDGGPIYRPIPRT